LVSRFDGFGNLDRNVQGFPGFQGMSADALPQALPLDEVRKVPQKSPANAKPSPCELSWVSEAAGNLQAAGQVLTLRSFEPDPQFVTAFTA
jgi:hypothetical protein